jgi:hypothetical protein
VGALVIASDVIPGDVFTPGMLTEFEAAEFAEDPTPFTAWTTNV